MEKVTLFDEERNINLLGSGLFDYFSKLVVKNHYLSRVVYYKTYKEFDVITNHKKWNNDYEPSTVQSTVPYEKIKIIERNDKIGKILHGR